MNCSSWQRLPENSTMTRWKTERKNTIDEINRQPDRNKVKGRCMESHRVCIDKFISCKALITQILSNQQSASRVFSHILLMPPLGRHWAYRWRENVRVWRSFFGCFDSFFPADKTCQQWTVVTLWRTKLTTFHRNLLAYRGWVIHIKNIWGITLTLAGYLSLNTWEQNLSL